MSYHLLRRGQAFEATKFLALTGGGGQPRRPEIDPVARRDSHDASRSGPPGDDLEGGRYLAPPEIKRREPRRRVHDRAGVTIAHAVGAAARVEEAS